MDTGLRRENVHRVGGHDFGEDNCWCGIGHPSAAESPRARHRKEWLNRVEAVLVRFCPSRCSRSTSE